MVGIHLIFGLNEISYILEPTENFQNLVNSDVRLIYNELSNLKKWSTYYLTKKYLCNLKTKK